MNGRKNEFWRLFGCGQHYLILLFCLLLPAILPCQVSATPFYVDGVVHVHAVQAPDSIYRSTGILPQTTLSDFATVQGPVNNVAISQYYADLSTGRLGAQASATNGPFTYPNGYVIWYGACASTLIEMYDTLHFTVPAGTYDQGVNVVAQGWVDGGLSRMGDYGGTAIASFGADFGSGIGSNYSFNKRIDRNNGETGWSISDNYALSSTLVSPGSTLSSDQTFSRSIRLYFGLPTILTASTEDNVLPTGSSFANADFFNTAGISSIVTPSGVTWTSASGVFLSQATPVPVPSSLLLLCEGILGTAGLLKKFQYSV